MSLTIAPITDLAALSQTSWDRLNLSGHVFSSYDFLVALELGDGLRPNGWFPHHLLIHPTEKSVDESVAALIMYAKNNSMGEFVFDFIWADAYQRYQLDYYPKLLSGIPFTPVTGPRLLCAEGQDPAALWQLLQNYLRSLCETQGYSSHHINFCLPDEVDDLEHNTPSGYWQRQDSQFHWHNQDYDHFDDFLSTLISKRRKNIRRERRLANNAPFVIREYTGNTLPEVHWEALYQCYAITFFRHGRPPPIPEAVFQQWAARLGERMPIIAAFDGDQLIAAAIFFRDDERLYGRYWGDLVTADSLHFELCYYRGIELCIREKLSAFEPGAQGEHKIWRGFDPVTTHSLHYLAHSGMSQAVGKYLSEEISFADDRQQALQQHSAYRKSDSDSNPHSDTQQ